jgi:hypothetical protein
VIFIVMGVGFGVAGFVTAPAILLVAALSFLAAILWWARWRRFLDDSVRAARKEYARSLTDD